MPTFKSSQVIVLITLVIAITTQKSFLQSLSETVQNTYDEIMLQQDAGHTSITRFAEDLEAYIHTFKGRMNKFSTYSLAQTLEDDESGRYFNITYTNFTTKNGGLNTQKMKYNFNFKFNHRGYDINVTDLTFQMDYDFSIIDPDTLVVLEAMHAQYFVHDFSLKFGHEVTTDEPIIILKQTEVVYSGPHILISDVPLSDIMNEYLTKTLTNFFNKHKTNSTLVESPNMMGRSLFEIPNLPSFDQETLVKMIEEKSTEILSKSQETIESKMQELKGGLNRRLLREDNLEEEDEDSRMATENFYLFLEEVHQYKLDTGLDEDDIQKKLDETDVFDTLSEIKQKVEKEGKSVKVNTEAKSTSFQGTVEKQISTTTTQVKKESEWTPQIKAKFEQVLKDFNDGKLVWEQIEPEKVKNIERKVNWEYKVKQGITENMKLLKEQAAIAEQDLTQIAEKAIKSIGSMFNFP